MAPPGPEMMPGDEPANLPAPRPPPASTPGPFTEEGTKDPAIKATDSTKQLPSPAPKAPWAGEE